LRDFRRLRCNGRCHHRRLDLGRRDLGLSHLHLRHRSLSHLDILFVGSILFLKGTAALCRTREEDTGLDGVAGERLGPLQNVWVGCQQVWARSKETQVILILILLFQI
jgi:hypothetical protein